MQNTFFKNITWILCVLAFMSCTFVNAQVRIIDNKGTLRSITNPVVTLNGDYTLTAADDRSALVFNRSNGANIILTVPAGLPIGFNISIYQVGTDAVNITVVGSVIRNRLNRFTTAGQHAAAGLLSTATNVYHLSGDLRI